MCKGGFSGDNCENKGVCTTATDGVSCGIHGNAKGDMSKPEGKCTCACNNGWSGDHCGIYGDFCPVDNYVKAN
jgi:hypothetical protein